MDIREDSIEEETGYLQAKINKLNTFFSLVIADITSEEKSLLEQKVIECYEKKGITFSNESLYVTIDDNKLITDRRFKKSEEMPRLEDLYKILKTEKRLARVRVLIKPYVNGSLKFLNGYTNIDLTNKFVVADISKIEETNLTVVMFVLMELFWDKIKVSKRQKKIIYLDEVWRLIGSNEGTANTVFKMFKTIRKYGGAVTAITQDINDFFSIDNGKYGKGILNNSSIKTIFQLEENDLKTLKDNITLSEEETYKIQNAKRGICLLYAGSNHIIVSVEASKKEHEFISTDRKDN